MKVRCEIPEHRIEVCPKNQKYLYIENDSLDGNLVLLFLDDSVIKVDGRQLKSAVERCMNEFGIGL